MTTKPQLLSAISVSTATNPASVAVCPDFEFGQWRYKALAKHLFDWLPEVALSRAELELLAGEPMKQLSRAARRVWDVESPDFRGEVGEIISHIVCTQNYGTEQFVARLFYKFRSNDAITSIDLAHTRNNDADELELWLGEGKIYNSNLANAMSAAFVSISDIWNEEFLTEMKALLCPKIESSNPNYERLQWLFSEEVSLDEIVDRIVIPIVLCVDDPETAAATHRSGEYINKIEKRISRITKYFSSRVPENFRFVCIYAPLDSKAALQSEFDKIVKVLQ